eukprot:TRINITY_DN17224_c0_g1_i1.p1 TRINITY_DN17224_c0_g1~~TRINITY_DN17224_c0_g1_i1.p1  ORF type:complete len:174 (+),score=28.64 TRINITY_DN17224_c0_g1_i1:34-555(+)
MGFLLSLFKRLEDKRVVMIGLDNAGKTTILYNLKLGGVISTIPTVGFNIESIQYKKFELIIWDLGGQKKSRTLWKHYLVNADAIIYVVDSSDVNRIEESREELNDVLKSEFLKKDSKVLIYANKQDIKDSFNQKQIYDKLKLQFVKQTFHVQPCSALNGDGLKEGLEWLSNII